MPTVFILEIKSAKNNKIFNSLNGCFSVMGGPMDMISGLFSEIIVRLLKSIISQFFSKYRKRCNILNGKSCLRLETVLGSSNYMCLVELDKSFLEWSWKSLWHLWFVVSFSCKTLWMQITADVGKTTKTVQRDPMFIFNELSEFVVNFVSNLIFW